ncbi:MAG: hypothetical protein QW051_00270 [Candidatus Aenigmatarchaeota archaeon]
MKKASLLLLTAICFFFFLASANAVSYIDACTTLSVPDEVYYLTSNVSTTGTCFTIMANNITLDCQGYAVNYSSSTSGYAVRGSGVNDMTIKNCKLYQTGTSSSSYAIYFGSSTGYRLNVSSTEIYTRGSSSHGIYLNNLHNANISDVNITTTGSQAYAFYFYTSNNATVSNTRMNTSQANALLIYAGSTYSTSESFRFNHTFTNCYAEGLPFAYYFNLQNQRFENQNWTNTYGMWVCGYCNNITLSNITIANDGIAIYKTQNSNIKNITIDADKGNALLVYTYSRNNVFENLNLKTRTNANLRALTNYYSTNNTFKNVVINTSTSGAYALLLLTNTNDTYSNFSITTTGTSGIGVYFAGSQTNTTLSNVVFSSSGSSAYGVYAASGTMNANIYDSSFTTSGSSAYAFYGYGGTSNINFYNTILNASRSGVQDVFFRSISTATGTVNLINSTFNKSESFFIAGSASLAQAYIKWYVDVNVTDSQGNALENATVRLRDAFKNLEGEANTTADGFVRNIIATEEKRNSTGSYSYNNHSLVVFKKDYNAHLSHHNITSSSQYNVSLTEAILTMPYVTYVPPTPNDGAIIQEDSVFINVSVHDYDFAWITPTAVHEACGEDPPNFKENTIDSDMHSFWSHGIPEQHYIAYDYEASYTHSKLAIYIDPSFPEGYVCGVREVYVSDDPNAWGDSLGSITWEVNAPDWYYLDFNDKTGRYLKIVLKIYNPDFGCVDTYILNAMNEFQSYSLASPGSVDSCWLEWTNSTGSENKTMTKASSSWNTTCFINMTNLSNGDYSFRAYANDSENNLGFAARRTITIQVPLPPTVIFIPPTPENDTYSNNSEQEIWVEVDKETESCILYWNETQYRMTLNSRQPWQWFYKFSPEEITEGEWHYYVTCDEGISEQRVFHLDLTLPTVTINKPENNAYFNTSIINFSVVCGDTNLNHSTIFGDWGKTWITPVIVYAKSGEDLEFPASNTIDDDLDTYWSYSIPAFQWIQYKISDESKNYSKIRIYTDPTESYGVCGVTSIQFSDSPMTGWGPNVLIEDCNFESGGNVGEEWFECSFNTTSGKYVYVKLKISDPFTQYCVNTEITPKPLNEFFEFDILQDNGWGEIASNYSIQNNECWNFTQELQEGTYKWQALCFDKAGNSNISEIYNFTIDITPPQWSNNLTDVPEFYSPVESNFFITWIDNTYVDTVLFESNYSGSPKNYSMIEIEPNVYYYSTILPAGTFYWRSYANDSVNNLNVSDTLVFTIRKAHSDIALYFNDTRENKDYQQYEIAEVKCDLLTPSNGYIYLWTNYSDGVMKLWSEGEDPLIEIINLTETGYFGWTCNWSGNENYTENSETHFMNITLGQPPSPGCNCSSCYECNLKLNDENCDEVLLIANISSSTICINNPENFNNKTFNCQSYVISGNSLLYGIYLNGKNNNIVKSCVITNFDVGIYLYNSSNNSISDTTLKENEWALSISENSQDNLFINIDVGFNFNATAENVKLKSDYIQQPINYGNLNKTIKISKYDDAYDSYANIEIGYKDSEVEKNLIIESTLMPYAYDGKWSQINDTEVDIERNYIRYSINVSDEKTIPIIGEKLLSFKEFNKNMIYAAIIFVFLVIALVFFYFSTKFESTGFRVFFLFTGFVFLIADIIGGIQILKESELMTENISNYMLTMMYGIGIILIFLFIIVTIYGIANLVKFVQENNKKKFLKKLGVYDIEEEF